ncbi:carboxypeptidase regulatory-like domain-containing protein [Kinneretia aquatilis]|uniref:carboxypeptidase regulatory-like domain-containing protein n=1 Tax=Kinneretia aquatilis TaxID=2070761 RepID=UPI0014950C70|nr:carboxypeptidase regulatory-like domain-containing protein [Paucibacter aquatile]WIV97648.1 hypothetical protein K9V56_021975 [Paucibacter aquatile]
MRNTLPVIVGCLRAGVFGALLGTLVALPAWAQPKGPAPGVSCIASAQNRSTPLTASGDYVLENLPGSGIAPFGVGASGQPFRVRVTCDDGTVGETPLTFPAFEQQLIIPEPIVWGLKTPVPSSLRLEFSKSVIGPDAQLRGSTTARYPDGSEKSVTARASGTGYRSSAAGFVGVDEEGKVFLQSNSFQTFASMMPIPAFVTITAENDGVTTSRILKLVGPAQLSGRVTQADGSSAGNLEVRLSIPGHEDKLVRTEASGNYRFTDLPFLAERSGQVTVLDRVNRRATSSTFYFDYQGGVQPEKLQLQLGSFGVVRVRVVDAAGAAQPGVEVGVSDAYARAVEGGSLPLQRTDSNGDAFFDKVNPGEVSVLSGRAGYIAEPGVGYLGAGSILPFVLRGGGASPALAAALVGEVLHLPNRTPAVGVSVELMRDGTGVPLRQIVDGSGSYAFRGLAANSSYRLVLKLGAELVRETWIQTSGPGGERRQDFLLDPQLGMLGQVFAKDGVTAVAGATLQLSWYDESLRTWRIAATGTSRADGAFGWRYLGARAYRLEAVTNDGASARIDVDLSAAAPGTLQNVRLQLNDKIVQTRLGLRATVMGAANYGALDAQLFVKNSACPTACATGLLRSTGDRLEREYLPYGRNEFELRWKGRVQAFIIDVSNETDGQTLERLVDFPAEASGTQRIAQQRSLFSFEAVAGEAIDATVLGLAVDSSPAARAVKLELYGPDGAKLGEGRGFDPARNPAPAAQALRGLYARFSGRHTLIVSPLTPEAVNLGSYGMLVTVAGRATLAQAWTAVAPARFGAQAAGRVFLRNGAPASGQPVLVRAGVADQIQLVEQVTAAADGRYAHQNLPLGPVVIEAMDADGVVLARAQGSLQADGDLVERDLHMAARTRVALSLQVSAGSVTASGGNAKVSVVDAFNSREVQLAVPAGALNGSVEFAVAGDHANLKVNHPSNPLMIAERTVTANDGGLVSVDVAMPTGRVQGRVIYGTSEAASHAPVSALDTSGVVIGQARAASDGRFVFLALPANSALRIQVRDAALDVSKSVDLMPIEAADVSSGELVLPTASVSGSVKNSGGALLSSVAVEAAFAGGSTLSTTTDASGRYAIARIPAGREVSLTASDQIRGRSQSVVVQGAVGERVVAPDIVFAAAGTTVQGRLRTTNGKPLANVRVWINDRRTGAQVYSVLTDATGNYTFYDVPQLDATIYSFLNYTVGWLTRSSNVLVSGARGAQVVPDLVFEDIASLRLRVVDPTGVPVTGLSGWPSTLDLWWSGESGSFKKAVPFPAPDGDLYESLAAGGYWAEWTSNSGRIISTAPQALPGGSVKNLDVIVPLLKGRLVYSDGSPVSSGSVWMNQSEAGNFQVTHGRMGGAEVPGGAPVPNAFVIAPLKLGAYTLVAQDRVTGLERRWSGRFTSLPSEPMTLVMPDTARVDGCVTAADGRPTRPDEVKLLIPASDEGRGWVRQMSATPNAAGCFSFPQVPTGDVVLQVFSGGWNNALLAVQRISIPPSAKNTTVQANIRYPVLGHVKCLTPAAESLGATETMFNTLVPLSVEQSLSNAENVYPDLNLVAGNCLQQFVLPGKYRAEQIVHNNGRPVRGHVLDVQVGAGQEITGQLPAAITPPISNHSNPPPVPVGATTYHFDTDSWRGSYGRVIPAVNTGSGYEQTFFADNAPSVLLNGLSLPPRKLMLAKPASGSREFAIGPFEQDNRIQLTRRAYVPETGGYMRLIEMVTNNSDVTQTVKLELLTPGNSYCYPSRTAGVDDGTTGYVGYQDCTGAMLHVYAGVGAAASQRASSELAMLESSGGVNAQLSMTLAPGQSGAIMHFVMVAPVGDPTLEAIIPLAEALARLGEVEMLQEMTAGDRSLIRNFTIGQ